MRERFFMFILIGGTIAGGLYFLYTIVIALYRNWDMTRGVTALQRESEQQREKRRQEAANRLDNDCEHIFEHLSDGLPPDTCFRCGLERKRPSGPCDHVWKPLTSAIPSSQCERCGQRYSASADPGDPLVG